MEDQLRENRRPVTSSDKIPAHGKNLLIPRPRFEKLQPNTTLHLLAQKTPSRILAYATDLHLDKAGKFGNSGVEAFLLFPILQQKVLLGENMFRTASIPSIWWSEAQHVPSDSSPRFRLSKLCWRHVSASCIQNTNSVLRWSKFETIGRNGAIGDCSGFTSLFLTSSSRCS